MTHFRFDLPNKRSVAVRESSSAALFDVVEPIMRKNGYNIENFIVHLVCLLFLFIKHNCSCDAFDKEDIQTKNISKKDE